MKLGGQAEYTFPFFSSFVSHCVVTCAARSSEGKKQNKQKKDERRV